jgi:hypothetical protein
LEPLKRSGSDGGASGGGGHELSKEEGTGANADFAATFSRIDETLTKACCPALRSNCTN